MVIHVKLWVHERLLSSRGMVRVVMSSHARWLSRRGCEITVSRYEVMIKTSHGFTCLHSSTVVVTFSYIPCPSLYNVKIVA